MYGRGLLTMMLWWCSNDDVMIMLRWYDDVTMMLWWGYGDVTMMSWWCYDDVMMILRWCYDDVMMTLWWCYDDDVTMMLLWWCYDNVTMMLRCHYHQAFATRTSECLWTSQAQLFTEIAVQSRVNSRSSKKKGGAKSTPPLFNSAWLKFTFYGWRYPRCRYRGRVLRSRYTSFWLFCFWILTGSPP